MISDCAFRAPRSHWSVPMIYLLFGVNPLQLFHVRAEDGIDSLDRLGRLSATVRPDPCPSWAYRSGKFGLAIRSGPTCSAVLYGVGFGALAVLAGAGETEFSVP